MRPPLERQEVVVAAAAAGIAAAHGWARLVDRAAALVGVEERADAAEMLVGLAANGILAAVPLDRELGLGLLEGEVEMLGKPLHVPLVEGDQRVGAAVTGALFAVIHRARSSG